MADLAPHRPVRLRCEHRLGVPLVDTPRPRFTWELPVWPAGESGGPDAALRQILLVATSPEKCTRQDADVWSCEVARESDRPANSVDYGGPALDALRSYHWTVVLERIESTDGSGVIIAGEIARFRTGYLSSAPQTAKWIRATALTPFDQADLAFVGDQREYEAVYYRHRFPRVSVAGEGLLVIATTGVYRAWVNGTDVSHGYLEPAPTDFARRAHYTVHDVGHLLDAENEILVAVGNGRSVEAYGYGPPMLLCELIVDGEDGRTSVVASGADWEAGSGPIARNGIYYGCTVDARRSFESSGPVAELDGPPLTAQYLEPVREIARLEPIGQWRVGPGRYVFDFGRVIAGVCSLRLRSPRGHQTILRHAELLTADGRLNTRTNRAAVATDTYIAAGAGEETFRPDFTYHGFRYVEVTGYPGVPTTRDISAHQLGTDLEPVSKLAADDPVVEAVHRNTLAGQRANIVGLPTDCPQRDERQGWLGDYQLIIEELCHNFHAASFLHKTYTDIVDSRRQDGSIPDLVPAYWKLYPADPAWGSAFVQNAWYLYWFYGDERPAQRHFDEMLRYVDFVEASAPDGVVTGLGKYGDWCPPGSIAPKNASLEFTSTWYLYHDLRLLQRLAAAIDRPADASALDKRAAAVAAAFNRSFLRDGAYRSVEARGADSNLSQTAQVLPLALDMVPAAQRDRVAALLIHLVEEKHDGHLDTGIVGTRYLFDVLSDLGRTDLALRVATTPSYPGYGYMLANGATSLWERWELLEGGGMNSHNHVMLGSVDTWFFERLAGLRCAGPGWSKIDISPHVDGPLRYASASVHTPRGSAEVQWEKSENDVDVTLTIHVPAQSVGRLRLAAGCSPAHPSDLRRELPPGHHEIRLARNGDLG
ncbi:MAG: family 78 glycoside hydrolase catalytic domain [Spirochaetes bacterium]|jgi:alpha-L-rhamnosidase|nr:family 78 glycoside hydrolase catalytic domain [Spirochaetota bacterium]